MGEVSAIDRGASYCFRAKRKRLGRRTAARGVRGLATHVHVFDKKLPTGTTSQPIGKRALLQRHQLVGFVALCAQLSPSLLHKSTTARPSSAMQDGRLPSPPQGVATPYGHQQARTPNLGELSTLRGKANALSSVSRPPPNTVPPRPPQ